jgi:hypothetical protein
MTRRNFVRVSVACIVVVTVGLSIVGGLSWRSPALLPDKTESRAETAQHYVRLLAHCRTSSECADVARDVLDAVNDLETLKAMARLCTRTGRNQNNWSSFIQRVGLGSRFSSAEAYHAGWRYCVRRIGSLGSSQAAETLLFILLNDYNGEEGTLFLCDTLVRIGTPALQALDKLQGDHAPIARQMAECIRTGKSFW